MFLATLRGTGIVLLQSLPFSRMADRILQNAPVAGGSRKGPGVSCVFRSPGVYAWDNVETDHNIVQPRLRGFLAGLCRAPEGAEGKAG